MAAPLNSTHFETGMLSGDRWMALGFGSPRAAWLRRVTEWSVSGAIRLDFIKCVSFEEVIDRLTATATANAQEEPRTPVALIVDASFLQFHIELTRAAIAVQAVLIAIGPTTGNGEVAGDANVIYLSPDFDHRELAEALQTPVLRRGTQTKTQANSQQTFKRTNNTTQGSPPINPPPTNTVHNHMDGESGHLVAVLGRPGSGTSTTAIALAQGLGDRLGAGAVLLADLSRYGDQALLHDSPDVVPGIQELISEDTTSGIHHLTYEVAERGYDLLLGMRRRRDWASLRSKPFQEAITAMRRDYRIVIADLDDDLEGKSETGSADIEARNLATRHVVQIADAVLVIGTASLVGARSMLQIIDDLHSLGVAPHRVQPLITHLRSRSNARQHHRSVSRLLSHNNHLGQASHSPYLRHVDDAHRNGTRLPNQLVTPALAAVDDLLGTLEITSHSMDLSSMDLRQTA